MASAIASLNWIVLIVYFFLLPFGFVLAADKNRKISVNKTAGKIKKTNKIYYACIVFFKYNGYLWNHI
jgi:hypothetical protein